MADEYERPTILGVGIGTGPREVAEYTRQSKLGQPPVLPTHVDLLKRGPQTS